MDIVVVWNSKAREDWNPTRTSHLLDDLQTALKQTAPQGSVAPRLDTCPHAKKQDTPNLGTCWGLADSAAPYCASILQKATYRK